MKNLSLYNEILELFNLAKSTCKAFKAQEMIDYFFGFSFEQIFNFKVFSFSTKLRILCIEKS
jgi:hypothetical protein